MVSLRTIATTTAAAVLIGLAACAPPPGDPSPPLADPAAAFVAALPACADTVTVMTEGQLPPCRPVDHTADGTGLPSQRLDLTMALHGANAPTYAPEDGSLSGKTPSTGYGGVMTSFNLQTMTAVCRQIDPALAWWALIDPASVAA